MERERYITLAIVCLLTHIIRSVYEILKHKKKIHPNRISFIIILVNMIILWISWFMLCSVDFNKVQMPGFIQYSGISLVGIGVLMFFIALWKIKSLESYEGDLITSGIYSVVRHPMYLAFVFWLIGFPLYFGSILSLLLSFIFIMNVLSWRHLEELELLARFPAYRKYRETTMF